MDLIHPWKGQEAQIQSHGIRYLTDLDAISFSIVLEFRQFLLKVTSDSESSVLKHKKTTWKSKLIRIIKKLRFRYPKKRAVSATKASNSPCNSDKNLKVVICITLLALGIFLASNHRGFMTISSVILFLFRMIFKRFKLNDISNLSAMLLVSTLACFILLYAYNYSKYFNLLDYVCGFVCKASDYFTSSGNLYSIIQIVWPNVS